MEQELTDRARASFGAVEALARDEPNAFRYPIASRLYYAYAQGLNVLFARDRSLDIPFRDPPGVHGKTEARMSEVVPPTDIDDAKKLFSKLKNRRIWADYGGSEVVHTEMEELIEAVRHRLEQWGVLS